MCASSHCKKTTITVMKLLAGAADSRNSSALADATEIHMLMYSACTSALWFFSETCSCSPKRPPQSH